MNMQMSKEILGDQLTPSNLFQLPTCWIFLVHVFTGTGDWGQGFLLGSGLALFNCYEWGKVG